MTNSQGIIFSQEIDRVLELLDSLVRAVHSNKDTELVKREIISFFIDLYSQSFLDELAYILDQLDFDLSTNDKNNLRNSVETSAFYRTNYTRIATILSKNEDKIRKYIAENPDKTSSQVVSEFSNVMKRLGFSETQISIEQASVDSAIVIGHVTDTPLTKTWNSLLDKKTCPTCTGLHGVTIPVTESFAQVTNNPDIIEDLSYTGGNTAYAHPFCRCWLTYSKA